MKGRISWDGKYSGIVVDWSKLVDNPLNNGYYVEAFSSADAIIDSQIESMLRQIFNSFESQSLINELESTREESKFFGSGMLKILKNINVIGGKLYSKVLDFKRNRNKVSHNMYGEYSLVRLLDYPNQSELDQAVEDSAKKILGSALDIFSELVDINKGLSDEFKNMNPSDKVNWLIKKRQNE
ncbi:MAG: hypothetical protein IH845_05510 [Nanoarchaeota archaeon]|nr:hypothetical protein [Nanoarchaeota archaeon]